MFASLWKRESARPAIQAWVEDEQHFCVGCPSLKKARGPLLRRMEQAHPGFAMLKDDDKFVRIVQQANLDSHIAKLLYIMFINGGVH